MRLIDADALPNELFKKHVHDGEELEPMIYFEDAVKVVENAPTIDAIPVEWLETVISKFKDAGRMDSVEVVQSLIKAWRYEEELKGQLEAQLVCMAKKIFKEMDEKGRNAIIEKLGYVPWSEEELQDE